MTQQKKNRIIGYSIGFFIIAIPLALLLGPTVFIGYAVAVLLGLSKKDKGTPKTTDHKQKDTELITVIQPTIDPKS